MHKIYNNLIFRYLKEKNKQSVYMKNPPNRNLENFNLFMINKKI